MKKTWFIIIFFLMLIFSLFFYKKYLDKEEKLHKESEIKSHYNNYVITTNKTKLYKLNNSKYEYYGNIEKNMELELDNAVKGDYFYIPNLDLYIKYSCVKPIDSLKSKDGRYKNYIVFNENIKTKDVTKFYNNNKILQFSINKSFDFSIIIKDNEYYGVEFNNNLYYIKKDEVVSLYENKNTDEEHRNNLRTLMYHFVYNPLKQECSETICHTLDQFESHLKYMSENNYFTLKMNEIEMFIEGKIQIPKKSIVITIDDGYIAEETYDLLKKYKTNATMFVITAWNDSTVKYASEYMDLESHTDNMHNVNQCKGMGYQGGGILCLSDKEILNDLKKSQEILGGSVYFAYPFFDYNERAIKLLKEAGFKMAFIGQAGVDGFSKVGTNLYKVPRKAIFSYTTYKEFVSYLN